MHDAEEVDQVVLPASQGLLLPSHPGEDALDDPAPLIAPQPATVVSLGVQAGALDVEVEGQQHQRDFMMVRGMCRDRERQAVTIIEKALLQQVLLDPLPLLISQTQHALIMLALPQLRDSATGTC